MATVTPNFNWPVPTSTDLVKDGATAIEALGDSIDASLVDLKGGTTGQVLSKNSNTDMDFIWVTDAAGDIQGVTVTSPLTGGGTSGTVTVGILSGTTSNLGAVQLSDSTSSTSTTLAATANAVKTTYDLAAAAMPGVLTLNAQTGTTYTFVLSDQNKLITASNASAQTYTIPLNSSVAYATGTQINLIQIGAGQVTVQGAGGVTVASNATTSSTPKCRNQYAALTCIKVATDTWYVIGDIA